MFVLFGLLIVWSLALLGFGRVARPLLRAADLDRLDVIGLSGLAGMVVLTVLASAASFFVGLGGGAAAIFCVIGLMLFFGVPSTSGESLSVLTKLGLVGLLVFLTFCGAREILSGDTGGYQMQIVQWNAAQSVVPGLANLHGRFGFNSSWWIFAAVLEFPLLGGSASYLANPLLLFFIGCLIAGAAGRWRRGQLRAADGILLLGAFLWLRQALSWNTPSLNNDSAANLATASTLWLMARCLQTDGAARLPLAVLATVLGAWTLTIKLNAVVLFLGALLVWLIVVLEAQSHWRSKLVHAGVGAIALLLGLWAGRGYMLSGYPCYPSTLGGISALPWQVPSQLAKYDADEIKRWPVRQAQAEAGPQKAGISRWLDNQMGWPTILAGGVVAALCGGAVLFALRRTGIRPFLRIPVALPAACAIGGMLFVILTAPAFRFMSGYFIGLAGLLISPPLLLASRWPAWARSGPYGLFLLGSAAFNFVASPWRPPALATLPQLPRPEGELRQTDDGLLIFVPTSSGNAWNVQRPSTPYFNPHLRASIGSHGEIRAFSAPR